MHSHQKQLSTRGFTLTELIVVLAIIAILFSIAAASFTTIRAKARDAARMSNVTELRKVLAFYNNDTGRYPVYDDVIITSDEPFSLEIEAAGNITQVPVDPLHPSLVYMYDSDTNGSTYTLSFCLETTSIQGYVQGCGNTITP